MLFILRSVIDSILRNPLRGLLTLLSVSLGVAAVTLVLNISFQIRDFVDRILEEHGSVLVIANAEQTDNNSVNFGQGIQFSADDAHVLKSDYPQLKHVTPINNTFWQRIEVEGELFRPRSVMGVGEDYLALTGLVLKAGRFISADDVSERSHVVVISEEAAKILYGGVEDAVGKVFFRFNRRRSQKEDGTVQEEWQKDTETVIGVYEDITDIQRNMYGIADILSPFSVNAPRDNRVRLFMASATKDDFQVARTTIEGIMRQVHGEDVRITVWQGNPRAFGGSDNIENLKQMVQQVTLFFGAFGMISLLISSFGIFSMMMVRILERTREIGLRRALGSSRAGITGHFMIEAVVLSFIGGVIGIAFAAVFNAPVIRTVTPILAQGSGRITIEGLEVTAILGLRAIGYSIAMTMFLGPLFGLIPALSAARVSPVESLREG